jgi:murein DD-endopeptidase MepM/ murein hydrolase activator NlpD
MPLLTLSRRAPARPLRATTVSLVAFVVALLAGTVAVAAGTGSRARAEATAAPAPVHDGLEAEQAWATAREERLAVVRQAEAAAARSATTVKAARPRPAPPTTTTSAPVTTTTAAAAPRVQAAATGPIVWPAAGALTGWFMERRGGARHTGIDIDGSTGDPVWAAAAGTVAWAGGAPAGYSGYGIVVIVDHGGGLQTVYAHLSAVKATAGQAVGPGDRIGSVGSTGHSTGSHLHFELRRDGVPVNPLGWLPPH